MTKTNLQINKSILIDWMPNRKSNIPIYSQIVGYFCNKVSCGDWVSGQSIPPQRHLSELFGVNRSTIVEAMDTLTSMGIIESRFGGGTRIANDSWSSLMSMKAPDWKNYLTAGVLRSNTPAVQIINHLEFTEGITRMSTGELSPDLVQTGIIQKVMSNLSQRKLNMNYPAPLGMPGLRTEIQKMLAKRGIDVPISCILIVSGALQALQLIAGGITQSKSTVYIGMPSYLHSLNVFQSAGATISGVPLDEKGIQPWMIKNTQTQKGHSLLYIIPTFQNPTGCVMPEERRREVLKYCTEHSMPIIEDDVFCDLWLDVPPPRPIRTMDKNGSVIYIGSLSKSFSPGLRLGWVVGPESVIERLADIKMQTDYGVSALTQQVTEEIMKEGLYDTGVQFIREHLRIRRDLMLVLLEKYFADIAEWQRPAGGFFIWVKLKHQVLAESVFKCALKEKMLVPPGTIYGIQYTSHLRLTYGYLAEDELKNSMIKLSKIIHGLLKQ